MNERIQELIRSADVHILPDDSEYGHSIVGLNKFSELLIKECLSVLEKRLQGDMSEDMDIIYCILDIENHFGVEL
jgi:hypothetical protein